jgi:hypothetical protein
LNLVADKVGDAGIRSSAGGIYQNTQRHLNAADRVAVQEFSAAFLPKTNRQEQTRDETALIASSLVRFCG